MMCVNSDSVLVRVSWYVAASSRSKPCTSWMDRPTTTSPSLAQG